MSHRLRRTLKAGAFILLSGAWIASASAQGDAKRGEYLAKAGGCLGCHTEEKKGAVPFAGGRALKTPFGTFYGPNITPHQLAGIGRWSEADFMRALRHGRRPDGANYFPAFPYPSFTKITDNDLRDLWAYLRTLPASSRPSREHDLSFFFGWRFLVTIWKWFFFTPGAFASIQGISDIVNRGSYLVQALGHCGECHTPRNFLGGPKRSRFLAGGKGRGKRAESDADRAQEVERQGIEGFPGNRPHSGRRGPRRGDGRGDQQYDQPADATGPCGVDRLPALAAAAARLTRPIPPAAR